MIREEQNRKLKAFITCLKCEVSGKSCDDNCPTQYEAGNMGEIIENLETIAKALEQEPCEIPYQSTSGLLNAITYQEATNLEPCEDCVSRADYKKWLKDWDITPIIKNPLLRKLESFPSVQPARIKAKWKDADAYNYRCSKCKQIAPWDYAYCPYCGAQMDLEDN